jgi:hypothetical protein
MLQAAPFTGSIQRPSGAFDDSMNHEAFIIGFWHPFGPHGREDSEADYEAMGYEGNGQKDLSRQLCRQTKRREKPKKTVAVAAKASRRSSFQVGGHSEIHRKIGRRHSRRGPRSSPGSQEGQAGLAIRLRHRQVQRGEFHEGVLAGTKTSQRPAVPSRRNSLGRLNTDGSINSTFTTRILDGMSSLLVQPDGRILVTGTITSVNGTNIAGIGRLLRAPTRSPTAAAKHQPLRGNHVLWAGRHQLLGGVLDEPDDYGAVVTGAQFHASSQPHAGLRCNARPIAIRPQNRRAVGSQHRFCSI